MHLPQSSFSLASFYLARVECIVRRSTQTPAHEPSRACLAGRCRTSPGCIVPLPLLKSTCKAHPGEFRTRDQRFHSASLLFQATDQYQLQHQLLLELVK